jgi:hypothetical protein
LRAHLPKGFVAARDGSAQRLLWTWPIVTAACCVLALGSFLAWRMASDLIRRPGAGPIPLHPTTRVPAELGLWAEQGMNDLPGDGEHRPLYFAAWSDGTLLWSERTSSAGGRPYRTGHMAPSELQALVRRVRAQIEAVPQGKRSNRAPDAGCEEIAVRDDDVCFRLSWWLSVDPESDPILGTTWRDARATILASIPAQGEPIALEGIDFEFLR